ncbi:MAG TPA: 50S ribosomal protein L10 [Fimbriimonadaceae bacterium]|nr:50S ribosomal protein L10 [Fimbriimonadaceae bacterium]
MPTAEKAQVIDQARAWYEKSVGVVFSDYRGLSVKEIQALRSDLKKKGGEIHVLKNTLFRIAVGDDLANLPAELHNGTTAFTFVYENETDVSKALVDYARSSRKLVVKGGYFAGKAFDAKQVEALAALPPRDVLIAQVIGAIASPLSGLIGTIEALYADPIRVIGAVADKVAEASPAPAPAPAPKAEAAPEPEAEASPEAPAAEAEPEAAPAAEAAAAEEPAAEPPAEEAAAEEPPAAE